MRIRNNTNSSVLREDYGARQILLHHVLVESGHYNHDEDTAKELFKEILPVPNHP